MEIVKAKTESKLNIINNISPLRYPGGKTRACKILDTILNEHFDITLFDNIVSPFFGGGSFEFYIQNKYQLNILANDKFTPLYNFWNICKSNKHKLCEELTTKIDTIQKDNFKSIREQIMDETNELKQGINVERTFDDDVKSHYGSATEEILEQGKNPIKPYADRKENRQEGYDKG